ncbi:MAG: DUF502 domain-containing protein [Fusobacteria bacterium]|nr:DUF502 domain-containing protein [Fusobacteriota bacterium]
MGHLKKNIKSNLILGFFAVLPLTIVVFCLYFIYNFIYHIVSPFINIFKIDSIILKNLIVLASIIVFLIIIFILGLLMRTRPGRFLWKHLESATLEKIPGYKAINETVSHFKKSDEKEGAFQQVGFLDPYGSDALMIGFITAETDERYTVFAPSSPNPTSGYVYHIKKDKFLLLKNTKMDEGLRAIISCGIGTEYLEEGIESMIESRKGKCETL